MLDIDNNKLKDPQQSVCFLTRLHLSAAEMLLATCFTVKKSLKTVFDFVFGQFPNIHSTSGLLVGLPDRLFSLGHYLLCQCVCK